MYDVKYTEEQLKRCSLNYLRSFARDLGGTPGLKKKDELVAYILDIQDEKFVPERKKSGRKPLNSTDMSHNWVTMINLNDDGEDANVGFFADSGQDDNVSGYLSVLADGIGVLKNGEKSSPVFVAKGMIDAYRLRNGDIVEGVREKTKNNAYLLAEVKSVNGREISEAYNRLDFDSQPAVYPYSRISFAESFSLGRLIDLFCPIGKGQRCVVSVQNGCDAVTLTEKFCEAMEKGGVRSVVAYPDCRPEDGEYLKKTCKEVMCSSFDKSEQEHVTQIKNALSRAKRIAEGGEHSAVIFGSFKAVEKALENNADLNLRQLFSSAKNTEKCCSLTMIIFSDDETLAKKYAEYFNSFIAIDGDKLDIAKSFTRRAELMIGSKTCSAVQRARQTVISGGSDEFIYRAVDGSSDEDGLINLLLR